MTTIADLLQQGQSVLRETSATPLLDAQLLLAVALAKPRSWLLSNPTSTVSVDHEQSYQRLLLRRVKHEPVAYILGKQSFFGLDLSVNEHVLIPRPDTECLVQEAINLIRHFDPEETMMIDVGTGSGAIAIAMSHHFPDLTIIGTDISPQAVEIAQKNARFHRCNSLRFQRTDLFQDVSIGPFSKIVITANLPYITSDEMSSLMPDVGNFEPHLALWGGQDGLDIYQRLFRQMASHLAGKEVFCLVECDPAQIKTLKKLIRFTFFDPSIRVFNDFSGTRRGIVFQYK